MPRAGLGKGNAEDTKLRGEVDASEGRAVSQRDLDRLEECASNNSIKFNKDKRKALCLGRHNPRAQYRRGVDVAGEQPCWKGPGGPGGEAAEREPAVRCCTDEGKADPGLHPQGHYQQG